jgi:hypothetical protein
MRTPAATNAWAMALPAMMPQATADAESTNEVFPLLCPMCGGQMRLIAFVVAADRKLSHF